MGGEGGGQGDEGEVGGGEMDGERCSTDFASFNCASSVYQKGWSLRLYL